MNNHIIQAAKQSWTRAKNLAKTTNTTPKQARSFLAQNPQHAPHFDKIDKRNPKTREIIQEYQNKLKPMTWEEAQRLAIISNPRLEPMLKKFDRPSQGDPTQPPRAGAPEHNTLLTKLTQTLNQANNPTINHETLAKLTQLAKETGGLPNLTYALALLNHLQI